MPDHPTLGQTLDFIREAHAGQTDRVGAPYWLHCVRVMAGLPADADDEMRHAALLHDVLEDTAFRHSDLLARGYDIAIINMVDKLTRTRGESYAEYITTLAVFAPRITAIKIADLRDNLSPDRAAGRTPEMEERYRKALAMLTGDSP